jgi:pimeloyl-ACP methyl ester carboxylesterase
VTESAGKKLLVGSTAGRQLATVAERQPFDRQRLVLGGASQGARFAVRLALAGALPARGFIAIVGAPPPEKLEPHLDTARKAGVRGFFITGERDPARAGVEAAHRLLASAGLEVRLPANEERGLPMRFASESQMLAQATVELIEQVVAQPAKYPHDPRHADVPDELDLRLAVSIESGVVGGQEYLKRINAVYVARQRHHDDHGCHRVSLIIGHDHGGTGEVCLACSPWSEVDECDIASPKQHYQFSSELGSNPSATPASSNVSTLSRYSSASSR